MQKAHLFEALYLVNHGIDEAVRGVQRLKKAPHAFREVYYKSVAGLERRRALINGQFMHEMAGEEEDNASFFEEEFNRWLSDDPLDNEEIYKLVALRRGPTEKNGRTTSRPVLEAEKAGERKRSPQASPEGHHPKTQKPPPETKGQGQSGAVSGRLGRPGRVTGAEP